MIKVLRTLGRLVKTFFCACVFFGSIWTPIYINSTYGRGWWTEPMIFTCVITFVGSIIALVYYRFDD